MRAGHSEIGEPLEQMLAGGDGQRAFRQQAAPPDVAGIGIGCVRSVDRSPYDRRDSVCTDDEIGRLNVAVLARNEDAIALLRDAIDSSTEDVGTFRHSFSERPIEVVPGNLRLRWHLAVDGESRLVEYDALAGNDAGAGDVFATRCAKNGERLALAQQSGSASFQPADRSLMDGYVVAVAAEQYRGEQAPERTSDDGDPHRYFLSWNPEARMFAIVIPLLRDS